MTIVLAIQIVFWVLVLVGAWLPISEIWRLYKRIQWYRSHFENHCPPVPRKYEFRLRYVIATPICWAITAVIGSYI